MMSNVDVEMGVSMSVDMKCGHQVVIFAWNQRKIAKSFFFCPRLHCHGFAGSVHSDSMSQVLSLFNLITIAHTIITISIFIIGIIL